MNKIDEKILRIKYIRNLDKFFNSAIAILKKDNFDKKLFEDRMLKNIKIFDKNKAVALNSTLAKAMEDFVNDCLNFNLSKNELLNKANNIDKLKNKKHKDKYKKY